MPFVTRSSQYPPDAVEKITGVPAEDLVKAARFYARSKPAAIQWGVPVDMTGALTPLVQAISGPVGSDRQSGCSRRQRNGPLCL